MLDTICVVVNFVLYILLTELINLLLITFAICFNLQLTADIGPQNSNTDYKTVSSYIFKLFSLHSLRIEINSTMLHGAQQNSFNVNFITSYQVRVFKKFLDCVFFLYIYLPLNLMSVVEKTIVI